MIFSAPSCDSRCSIVRGPMIADDDRRVLEHEAERQVDQRDPGLVGEGGQRWTASSLRAFSGRCRVVPGRLPAHPARRRRVLARAVPAGQPATGQRAPRQHAEAVLLGYRQHVALDLAGEDRVRRLLGDRTFAAAPLRDPLRLDDLRGLEGRRADVADLALADQVGQRAEGLVDVDVRAAAGAPGRGRSSRSAAGAGCSRPPR